MAQSYITKIKDPDEDLDYTWDFEDVLTGSETIASYEFVETPEAIVIHDESSSTTEVTAYVGPGGESGTDHIVTCRITTNASPERVYDRSIRFRLQTK